MRITVALVFIIAFTLTSTGQPLTNNNAKANSKREELPEGSEAAKAIARLGDLARPALRKKLKQMRPLTHLPDALLLDKIIKAQRLPIVSGKRVDQLKTALQPVLAYHLRAQMPIIVVFSDQPQAILVDSVALVITTRLMNIASAAEIRGIVAHELAHEYIRDEHKRARAAKNGSLLREGELFCDAVAAFTLKEIGDDPASYGRILERLIFTGITADHTSRQESDTHPSLDTRKKLNKFMRQQLD